jgi:hypothetical protein
MLKAVTYNQIKLCTSIPLTFRPLETLKLKHLTIEKNLFKKVVNDVICDCGHFIQNTSTRKV